MDMCRFTGLGDVEYKKFTFALERMIKSSAPGRLRRGETALGEEQKRMLLDSLRFDQIDARQTTIKNAHAKTCKWLLKNPEYLDWLDVNKLHQHHGFLWIKGKPGTGKSTLVKFAFANARRTKKDRLVISFFFNARGEDLEKSTTGTYRSLLLQLLERLPALQHVFESLGLLTSIINSNHQWSIEALKTVLEQAILSLGENSVLCFIDALDECEERQVRDLVSFFEHIGELVVASDVKFQVCFSSRHYPFIIVSQGLSLILEGQEGHNQDVTNYLDHELKIGHSKTANEIRSEVQAKSSGIFMWAVLVVEILNKEYDSGRIHTLRQRLREIPSDLHELFRDILTRDTYNRKELILCIQWILFARQLLNPQQLYFAIISGTEPGTLLPWDAEEITADTMKKFILSSSKGLAEITMSKVSKVQFIHESVKDFLLKENGLGNIWPELGDNFQNHSHDKLKGCCLTYMNIDLPPHLEPIGDLLKASSPKATALRDSVHIAFPFLEYAVNNVLYHANEAVSDSLPQKDFIHNFPLTNWIKFNNLFEKHEIRRYTQNASLLYILAENNLPNLMRIHPSILSYLEVEDERYGSPLLASLAAGSKEAFQSFLKAYALTKPPNDPFHEFCSQHQPDESTKSRPRRNFKFSKRRTQLSYLAEFGEWIMFVFLLEKDEIDVNSRGLDGRTPLWYASANGNEAIVRLLAVRADVNVDMKDEHGQTPLSSAAENGHEAVVDLLVVRANANAKDIHCLTPLSWAARNGHEAVVRLLAARADVDVDAKDNWGRTPLSWAAKNGHEAVVRLLMVLADVDVNVRDHEGQTPLMRAVEFGYKEVVRVLLTRADVDINTKDYSGRTPLSYALANGNQTIVKLLQEHSTIAGAEPD